MTAKQITGLMDLGRDADAIENGSWASPGEAFGTLELFVRGFGNHYQDILAQRQMEVVRAAQRDGLLKPREAWEDLPFSYRADLNNEILMDALFIDVRGLNKPDGQPMTAEDYRRYAKDPRFRRLTDAVRLAAEVVTARRATELEAATGNSLPSSETD